VPIQKEKDVKLYKLTDKDGYTRRGQSNALLWAVCVTHTAKGKGTQLCTDGVIHAYLSPELALFLNPIHAAISQPRLWEAEGAVVAEEGQLIVGVKSLTVLCEITAVQPTTEQRVKFAILCALSVYKDTAFSEWAENWLSGKDRSAEAAWAAAKAAGASRAAAGACEAAGAVGAAWAAAENAGAAGAVAGVAGANLVAIAHQVMTCP
jgi:hypothetical protein